MAASKSSPGSTSSSLLLQLKRHEPQAWERLVDLYGPLVFSWAKRCGLSSPDAADILQEVFIAIHSNVDRFERAQYGGSFRAWLWTITRNKVRDHIRRQRHRPTAAGGTDAYQKFSQLAAELEASSADDVAPDETTRLLRRALEQVRAEFEPQTFQAFWRVVIEGQSTSEVADDLGVSANAVRQAKSRVARRLRAALGDLE